MSEVNSGSQGAGGFWQWIVDRRDGLDFIVKILGVVGGISAGVWAIWQYASEEEVRSYEQAQEAWAAVDARVKMARCDIDEPQAGLGLSLPLEILARTRAPIDGIQLGCAELGEVNLSGARLTRAKIERSNLTKANLSDANLHSANFENSDLTGAKFRGALLADVVFAGAWLDYTDFTGARFHDDRGRGPKFAGACLDMPSNAAGKEIAWRRPIGLPAEYQKLVTPCAKR